jgi:hypothetical protein
MIRSLLLIVPVPPERFTLPDDWPGLRSVFESQGDLFYATDWLIPDHGVDVLDITSFLPKCKARTDAEADGAFDLAAQLVNNWTKQHEYTYSLVIAGQTPLAERCIIKHRRMPKGRRPYCAVRFSPFYSSARPPHPGSKDPLCFYDLDCPEDYRQLRELLTHPLFVLAIERKNEALMQLALTGFNLGRARPVLCFSPVPSSHPRSFSTVDLH